MADNDYEREREERIARNKAMLEQLQVAATAQSMGREAKKAADRKRKAPARDSAEPGTVTPSRRSSRSGAAATRLKLKASVPVGGSSSDDDDGDDSDEEDEEGERPSSSRTRRKADVDDYYDPSDNDSSDEEEEEEEEEGGVSAGRRPSCKGGMPGKEISTRARGGTSSRDTRRGSTALAAPARVPYQSHMKKMAGKKKKDEEEVDAAIARAVASTAVQRGSPIGTDALADAVDGGKAPRRNSKASGRSRGAQMAAMAAGRNKAASKAPDKDEVVEVSSGTSDEEDQHAVEDTDLQRAIAMSLGASGEGGSMRTEGQHSQEEAVAAEVSGGEEGRWAELPPEDISVRRVKRASGAKGAANSSRPDVPEEDWKRVFQHLSHGRSTVTAKDIQKVSADLGHPAGDMDDDMVSMMLRRASELTGSGSSCLRMAEFLDLADKMQASAIK